ncbi:MAG: leucine-rich repeat domain-containing protein [Bacteroidaceae bacterium]|nr:leucine-rich repeat domain-containing protein [Bacteroidaceae bacterium]
MKKLLSILALLCLVAFSASGRGFFPIDSWDSGDCTLALYDDGYLEVYGFDDMRMADYASDTYCPWYERRGEIKEIYIKGTVANIGANVFNGCTQLTTVTIGNAVTSIGADAFKGCSRLTEVEIPASVETIGEYAFSETALTSVDIPNSVTGIGSYAFGFCPDLQSATIGDGVKGIGDWAFTNCDKLESVTIGSGVTGIDGNVFSGCTAATDVYCYADPTKLAWYDDGKNDFKTDGSTKLHVYKATDWSSFAPNINATITGDLAGKGGADRVLWAYADGTLTISGSGEMADYAKMTDCPWYDRRMTTTRLVISDAVTSIGNYTFFDYRYLTTVDIPASVTRVGSWAFTYCSRMETATIGSGVTSIGYNAFYACTVATDVYCYADPTKLSWDDGDKDDFKTDGSTRCHVYDASAWSGFSENVNVTFAGDLIGSDAPSRLLWSYDAGTKTLTFSGTGDMTNIGISSDYPWNDYRSDITNIVLGEGITSIGMFAFYGCNSLTSVDIPASVTSLEGFTFAYCANLATVNIYAPSCASKFFDFSGDASNRKIYVFADKVEDYRNAENWSDYAGDILPLTLTANEGATGEYWTTYYNSQANCQVPEGTRVFTVALDGSSLELTEIDNGIINRGEGVVLKSKSGSIPLNYSAIGNATGYEGNELRGTMTRIANPGNAYVLNKKSAGVGFYRLSALGNVGAHKAYLTYDGGSGAREFIPFDEGDPTGIFESEELRVKSEESVDVWHDLSGRKYVSKPAKPGVYIHNGGKQVVP